MTKRDATNRTEPSDGNPPVTIVWFKRDLRLHDNAALADAAARGPVLPLYVVEPDLWRQADISFRHWEFFRMALADLDTQIADRGGALYVRHADILTALADLKAQHRHVRLVAHMETGNAWTHRRDELVRQWCRSHDVEFVEFQQYGVWRGSDANRDTWAKRWDKMMAEPLVPSASMEIDWAHGASDPLPSATELGLSHDGIVTLQPAGRPAAEATLHSFLYDRGEPYQRAMSSPVAGETACSRLSVHLMAGTLSMKEIYQATLARQTEIAQMDKADRGEWPKALKSFIGRLHWHCHFMQKLETEPELEWLPMARSYQGLRPLPNDDALLVAFETGQTGYPFVDACMRYLRATGWINFRMRAMLMSFASYDLWLPWQLSGAVLARLFTDYEPGIHWTQSQMQSGETGINSVRIYSSVKQGYDQDPTGEFTRKWVPELAHLDGKDLQEPWRLDSLPNGYPERVVDHGEAVRHAKRTIYAHRRLPASKAEADDVYLRHGSRKPTRLRQPPKASARSAQTSELGAQT